MRPCEVIFKDTYLTFVNEESKIFSASYLNSRRLFLKIVVQQNIMVTFNDITRQFIRTANVGNLVYVLLVVVTLIIKPEGAIMV